MNEEYYYGVTKKALRRNMKYWTFMDFPEEYLYGVTIPGIKPESIVSKKEWEDAILASPEFKEYISDIITSVLRGYCPDTEYRLHKIVKNATKNVPNYEEKRKVLEEAYRAYVKDRKAKEMECKIKEAKKILRQAKKKRDKV